MGPNAHGAVVQKISDGLDRSGGGVLAQSGLGWPYAGFRLDGIWAPLVLGAHRALWHFVTDIPRRGLQD